MHVHVCVRAQLCVRVFVESGRHSYRVEGCAPGGLRTDVCRLEAPNVSGRDTAAWWELTQDDTQAPAPLPQASTPDQRLDRKEQG